MKVMFKLLVTFCLMLLFPSFLSASILGTLTAMDVRIRSEANDSSNILDVVNTGDTLVLTSTTKHTGNGCNDGWYQLNYNDSTAYICSTWVSISSGIPGYNTSGWTSRVYGSSVYAWSDTNKTTSLDKLLIGTNLTLLETYSSNSKCSNEWYKVRYYNNKIAYVCGTSILTKSGITLENEDLYASFQSLGFPESYWPYLAYLKNKYPNWNFIPVITNLNWNNVINGEAGKNYIQSTNDAYRTSSTVAEPGGWYYAKSGVIAFYMDPRNFLNEKFIFMFEKLDFNSSDEAVYPNVLGELFGSSYLNSSEYINYFINAGRDFLVNPVHLGSRVVQEGGSNQNYSAVSGTSGLYYNGTLLNGYYNFFNVGAFTDSITSSPVTRGLAYAAGIVGCSTPPCTSNGRPWNTPEKAIRGGAQFLSGGYISQGQYTMYFQKFNTSPTASAAPYTHQYMTNVQAPASEALNTFHSYNDLNIIGNAYTFAIPIYNSIPIATSLPSIGNTNNNLSNITIGGNQIVGFDSDVINYTYYVPLETNSIDLNATAENTLSIVDGIGNIELSANTNNISITVVSEDGEVKTYYIEVLKVNDITNMSEIIQNICAKVNNDYISNIRINTQISSIINNILSTSPSSIITVKDSSGNTVQTTNKFKTGQSLTINSTSNEIKTFKVAVIGDVNGDGDITIFDLLKIQKHLLGASVMSNEYRTAADTNNDDIVTILDLLRVQKHLLKEINL